VHKKAIWWKDYDKLTRFPVLRESLLRVSRSSYRRVQSSKSWSCLENPVGGVDRVAQGCP